MKIRQIRVMFYSLWETGAAEQICEALVCTQDVEIWLNLKPDQQDKPLLESLFSQATPDPDRRDPNRLAPQISANVTLLGNRLQSIKRLPGLSYRLVVLAPKVG